MNRTKNLILLLTVCSISAFSLIMTTSCETKPVDSLSPEPAPPSAGMSQVAGEITDNSTDAGLSDVVIAMGSFNATTDAQGNFEFTDNIPGGNYTLTAQKTGYVSISKNVTVLGEGSTTYLKYKMAQAEPPIVVDPNTGTLIEAFSNDGKLTAFVPVNTFPEPVDVSLTPTLGLSSPIPTDQLLESNEAPLQTFRLLPDDRVYAQPVDITLPLTMPAQFITGTLEVVKVNIESATEEIVGNANIVNGEIVHQVNAGGDYMIRATTQLIHTESSAYTRANIGKLEPSELPGTGRIFNFNDVSNVQIEPGFSRDLIETIFRFTNSSRTLQYGLTKPSGTNTTVTGFLPLLQETHVFSTPTGMVAAKITLQNNNGVRNIAVSGNYGVIYYVCRQTSQTHNNWASVGYFSTSLERQLTQTEVNQLINLDILPASPPACP